MPVPRMVFWDVRAHRLFPEPVYFPKRFELIGRQRVRVYAKTGAGLKGNLVAFEHSLHFVRRFSSSRGSESGSKT
jgi:hypothetical protein